MKRLIAKFPEGIDGFEGYSRPSDGDLCNVLQAQGLVEQRA